MQLDRHQSDKRFGGAGGFGREIEDEELGSGLLHLSIDDRPPPPPWLEAPLPPKQPEAWATPSKHPGLFEDSPLRLAHTPHTRGTAGPRKSLPAPRPLERVRELHLHRASLYEKEQITAELAAEWLRDRHAIEQLLERTGPPRPKLGKATSSPERPAEAPAASKPLTRFRKVANSIIWINKLFKPKVQVYRSMGHLEKELDLWAAPLQPGAVVQSEGDAALQGQAAHRPPGNSLGPSLKKLRLEQQFLDCAALTGEEVSATLYRLLYLDDNTFHLHSKAQEHLLNKHSVHGVSPLHLACRWGNLRMVDFLVSRRCDLLAKCHGETALEVASRWNQQEVVEYLLSQPEIKRHASAVRQSFKKAASKSLKDMIKSKVPLCCQSGCALI